MIARDQKSSSSSSCANGLELDLRTMNDYSLPCPRTRPPLLLRKHQHRTFVMHPASQLPALLAILGTAAYLISCGLCESRSSCRSTVILTAVIIPFAFCYMKCSSSAC